jgi:hypothetical protein
MTLGEQHRELPAVREAQQVDPVHAENTDQPGGVLDAELGLVVLRRQIPAAAPAAAEIHEHHPPHVGEVAERGQQVGVIPARPAVQCQQHGSRGITCAAHEERHIREIDDPLVRHGR